MPMAFARSAGSVKSIIVSESETAETTAPPTPCMARAATSTSCEVASPQASEAAREERDPDQEEAPVAEEVAQPAAEQQEAAEGQQVRVHDPGERGVRKAEVLLDRRQRDVHDRHVEHDHQRRPGTGRRAPASGCVHPSSCAASFPHSSVSGIRPVASAELIARPEGRDHTDAVGGRAMVFRAVRRSTSYMGLLCAAHAGFLRPRSDRHARTCRGCATASARCSRRTARRSRSATSRRSAPDAVTCDALARLQLAAKRLGCQVRLRNASPELRELVAFMGLEDVLPC